MIAAAPSFAALLLMIATATAARAAVLCDPPAEAGVTVTGVSDRLDAQLADGRIVHFPDLDLPATISQHPAFAEARRAALAAWLVGRRASLAPVARNPDRWGRVVARLYADGGGVDGARAPLWAEQELVDAGWARVQPGGDEDACLTALLASETSARNAGLGLWADPYYAVAPASRAAAYAHSAGEMIIVQGRVASLGAARSRTFLNFGPSPRHDVSLEIETRKLPMFEAAGASFQGYVGRVVRARGLLNLGFGPRVEVSSPAQIEVIDDPFAQTKRQ